MFGTGVMGSIFSRHMSVFSMGRDTAALGYCRSELTAAFLSGVGSVKGIGRLIVMIRALLMPIVFLVVAGVMSPANAANCSILTCGDPLHPGYLSGGGLDTSGLPSGYSGLTARAGSIDWLFFNGGNPTPQDGSTVADFLELPTWFNLPPLTLVGYVNQLTGTDYSTSLLGSIFAVHFGGGEVAFRYSSPINNFFINGLTGLSNIRVYTITQTPIPAGALLFGSGLAFLGFVGRRRKAKRPSA